MRKVIWLTVMLLCLMAGIGNRLACATWDELAASATGGGVSNDAGNSGRPSLALDSSGRPHIAWWNYSGGGNWEIYYRYWNPFGGTTTTTTTTSTTTTSTTTTTETTTTTTTTTTSTSSSTTTTTTEPTTTTTETTTTTSSTTTTTTIPPNNPPDCSGAYPSLSEVWPSNHKMVSVNILGVTDPDGDPVTITITGITQDEPTREKKKDKHCPDGAGVGTNTAQVRAEREGDGNGRVYEISFKASDGKGGECTGSVTVCVPHDQRPGHVCVDDGQVYDSTVCP